MKFLEAVKQLVSRSVPGPVYSMVPLNQCSPARSRRPALKAILESEYVEQLNKSAIVVFSDSPK